MIERGADAVDAVLRLGAGRAMMEINRRPKPPVKAEEGGAGTSAPGTPL